MIYLDYAATTPLSSEALRVYHEVSQSFYGNANSLHTCGTDAKRILEQAFITLRKTINGKDAVIHLTSSGTSANKHALNRLLAKHQFQGHVLTCRTEHPSIREHLDTLLSVHAGLTVENVPVNAHGQIAVDEVEKRVRKETILATFAHVQHEFGTIRDLTAIGELLARNGVFFHSDCVQSYGKIPIPMKNAKLAAISTAAHKIYGPKALGAVFFAKDVEFYDELPAGTTDIAGVAAFASTAESQFGEMGKNAAHVRELRAKMIESLPSSVQVIGASGEKQQSSYILGLCLPGIEGQEAMLACDRQGVAIATGSACKSGHQSPPESLLSLGYSLDQARTFVRLSFGGSTTKADIEQAANCFWNLRVNA